MPATAETKVKARGGAKAYRTVKIGNRTMLVAVVPKAGPRGGHTVALGGPSSVKPQPVRKPMTKKRLRAVAKRRRKRKHGRQ